jgi:hypothetical protein
MASSEINGSELIRLINATNTRQDKLESLQDLKDYILEQDLDANVIMIMYLKEINQKISNLTNNIIEQQKITNDLLKLILS